MDKINTLTHRFKKDVKVKNIKPEITLALVFAMNVFQQYNKALIVTSITEGKHKKDSLHYLGYAVDLRTRHLSPEEQKGIFLALCSILTPDYDIVLESTHLHIEFDPK